MALEILIEEFVQLFLLNWGQRIDFGAEIVGIQHKFNGVVPLLLIRQFIEGLLSKDILELLVWLRDYVFKALGWSAPQRFHKFLGDGLGSSHIFHPSTYELN